MNSSPITSALNTYEIDMNPRIITSDFNTREIKINPTVIPPINELFGFDFNQVKLPNTYKGKKEYLQYNFFYTHFLDFFLKYIKNNNLKDSIDPLKFNFDENLIKFFRLLFNISEYKGTPLSLEGNFFYYEDCRQLFKLCVVKVNEDKTYFQDLTMYDFSQTSHRISQRKIDLYLYRRNHYNEMDISDFYSYFV